MSSMLGLRMGAITLTSELFVSTSLHLCSAEEVEELYDFGEKEEQGEAISIIETGEELKSIVGIVEGFFIGWNLYDEKQIEVLPKISFVCDRSILSSRPNSSL